MGSSAPPPDLYDTAIARARAASAALNRVADDLAGARIAADAAEQTMTTAQLLRRLNEDLNQ